MSDDKANDELVRGLKDVERKRRTRALVIGGVVAAASVLAFVLSIAFSDQLFQPELDVESGEKEVIAETNDPQCRGFIADVTAVGADYQKLEPELRKSLLSDSVETIEKLVADVEGLRERLKAARVTADDADFRFDNSRSEVNDWFRYTQNELHLLQKVGRERVDALQSKSGPDAGTVVAEAPGKDGEKSKKTPEERLEGAALAANEAFEKFRVWHTGGLHPCGKAAEGEQPWSEAEAKAQP